MDRIEFNKLNISGQVKYVNEQLKKDGGSLRNISAALNVSRTTFRERFEKAGYTFDHETRQYIEKYKSSGLVVKEESKENTGEIENYKDSGFVLPKEFEGKKTDLLELLEMKDILKKLLQDHHESIINIDQVKLKLDKNILNGEAVNRSIKMYDAVYKELQELYVMFPEFKRYDLLF
jgi:hypothetical protein